MNATCLLDIRHGGQDGDIQAGGIAVEVDELNAVCAANQRVVASGFKEAVDHGFVLQIRAVDNLKWWVGTLASSYRRLLAVFGGFIAKCVHLPTSRRNCLAW